MDTDIKPRINQLQESSSRNIFFSDIWHLFKPGDEVLSSDQRQIYRVVQITGITHHSTYANMKDSGHPMWKARPVVVHVMYMDFNGKLLGPVSKKVEIPKFDGERDVRSLPVYPLRFASTCEAIREKFIERGKFFMELTEVKHVHFTGVTLDTQEEVDSQVVVDFEQTLQHNSGWVPDIEPPPVDTRRPKPSEDDPYICRIRGCCDDEPGFPDDYVDQIRNRDFTRDRLASATYSRPIKDVTRLRDDELVLLTHRLFVFVLRSRKWGMSARFYNCSGISVSQ
jgi:hypothetical protein